MKKNLLFLFLAFITITAFAQDSIPNGNFEIWNSSTYNVPKCYTFTSDTKDYSQSLPYNVNKVSPGYHGSYAVELSTVAFKGDTNTGVIINVDPNSKNGGPNTWTGGMAYNQKPSGIRGYYKYNQASGDSATIIAIFSKSGINIGSYFYKIGGLHSSYNLFKFTFNPPLSTTPDSVIFGAVSSNIFVSKNGVVGSTLVLESVSFTGVNSQPDSLNGDFESWQTNSIKTPAFWTVQSSDNNGYSCTTDAAKGKYAIELKTFLGNMDMHSAAQMATLQNGYYDNSCNCMKGGYPFTNQIDTIAFFYKYTAASAADSASFYYNFKKNGSTIWGSNLYLKATTGNSYNYIEIPINTGQVPDTAIFQIQPDSWNDTLLTSVGCDLKIDDIHFKSQAVNTGIINYNSKNDFSFYPNPVTKNLILECPENAIIEITNEQGQILKSIITSNSKTSIDFSGYNSGVYFIYMKTKNEIKTKKFVKE